MSQPWGRAQPFREAWRLAQIAVLPCGPTPMSGRRPEYIAQALLGLDSTVNDRL